MDLDRKSLWAQRPGSPAPSCLSLKSDLSMQPPTKFSGGTPMSGEDLAGCGYFGPSLWAQRPGSPAPSCLSLKSDLSMQPPTKFSGGTPMSGEDLAGCGYFGPSLWAQRPGSPAPSCLSLKSDLSMQPPTKFSGGTPMSGEDLAGCGYFGPSLWAQRPGSPAPSCLSLKSDLSMQPPTKFSGGTPMSGEDLAGCGYFGPSLWAQRPGSPAPSCLSLKSDLSMQPPTKFSGGTPMSGEDLAGCGYFGPRGKRKVPPVVNCVSVKRPCVGGGSSELTDATPPSGQDYLYTVYTSTSEKQQEMEPSEDEEETLDQQSYIVAALQRHTLVEPSEDLDPERSKSNASLLREKHRDYDVRRVQMKHKTKLESTFKHIFEGIAKQGNPTLLNRIYTELYITEGEGEGVNGEHEVWQIESAYRTHSSLDTPINCNDIFKCPPGQEKTIRTVLTKGIAGIGKTVSVQKFILDWAEGKTNQDIDLIFVLPFRELNLIKDEQYSLLELLHEFHPELKEIERNVFDGCRVLFIFDGLDESRLPLNFKHNEMLTDVAQTASVDVLLTNLFNGHLLRSALLWITTRPAAASQIPAEYVDQVTEIRGFNDPQKEEYFHKRFGDEDLANRIISHIQSSRSLYIMCHIPVFCWISATVLEKMLGNDDGEEIPTTLTQMCTHFLLIQTNIKNRKYHGTNETSSRNVSQSDRDLILNLAELAFHQLEKGNIIFYEEDLRECGIDVSEASVYSGVCTQIFKEEFVMYQQKVYCFVHLSIQEFLAALYVFQTYARKKMDSLKLFSKRKSRVLPPEMSLYELHKAAVSKALKSKNGHLDLFLRFLLGLSLDSNKSLLQGLLTQTESSSETVKKTVKYIKVLKRKNPSPERCINLLHCLVEMNDFSLLKKVQKYQESSSRKKLTPSECSSLAYVLLMSKEVLDVLDISTFNTSPEGRIRLLPAVKCCRKAVLIHCKLTAESCGSLVSALQSVSSQLTELDLSYNHLGDSGVKELCAGLRSPHYKLHTLRLTYCKLTAESCGSVASALQSVSSQLTELDLSYNHLGDSGVKELCTGLRSPHCKLHTLRLLACRFTEESCGSLVSALQSVSSQLTELDLSYNHLGDSGVKELCAGLRSPHYKLHTLRLTYCKLTAESCGSVASALQSVSSQLTELDLSDNHLGDSGVKELCTGLRSPHCKLHTLRLIACKFTAESCVSVVSVLQSVSSQLTELDLSDNHLGDSGVKELCTGLRSPHCKLHTLRVKECNLTEECCEDLASVLKCPQSGLTDVELRDNDLLDQGVMLLSDGLKEPSCKLQRLGLSGCRVTEEGCSSLASALGSNPRSQLRELDLSYNHPGDSGVKLLSALLEDPSCTLEKVNVENAGQCRIRPGPRKYSCQLTLDPNTANTRLSLSEDNRTVTWSEEEQKYPDHPDRFDCCEQVLCVESLSGRCYWEVQWTGNAAEIGVTYKGIRRKGDSFDCRLGKNDKSWSLFCSNWSYSVIHSNTHTAIAAPPSRRVGVYVDCVSGTLSFYSISSGELTLLYRFTSTFTEPLYPAFGVDWSSSVSLCDLE